jgi:hypothetical protein
VIDVSRSWILGGVVMSVLAGGAQSSIGQRRQGLGQGWRVIRQPLLQIGQEGSDRKNELFDVVGAGRLKDGGIVVANAGTWEIRYYDRHGEFVRSVGRKGHGPGEFEALGNIQVGPGDTVYAFDRGLQRESVFGPTGELAWDGTFGVEVMRVAWLKRLADGYWVAAEAVGGVPLHGPGKHRSESRFFAYDPSLNKATPLAAVAGPIFVNFRVGADEGYRTPPYTPVPLFDTWQNCLYVTPSDTPTVRILTSGGTVVHSIATHGVRKQVTDADVNAWLEDVLGRVPASAKERLRAVFLRLPRPDSMPLYGDLLVDRLGDIWLGHYAPPTGEGKKWTVLSPTGLPLTTLNLPSPLKVLDIGSEYIIGVSRTTEGVEVVQEYRLERPDAQGASAPAACMATP